MQGVKNLLMAVDEWLAIPGCMQGVKNQLMVVDEWLVILGCVEAGCEKPINSSG